MFTPPQRLRRSLTIGVAGFLALALAAAPAAAHTELRGSDPVEGSTVDALDQVRLDFSSALLDIGAELILIDSEGTEHELVPEFPEGEHAVEAAVDAPAVAAGDVVLDWRIVAEDGHPIEGEINFAYGPAAAQEPADEPAAEEEPAQEPDATDEPVADEEQQAPEPTDQMTPIIDEPTADEPDEEPGSNSVWAWVLIGLAVVGLAVTAIAMSRKRDEE